MRANPQPKTARLVKILPVKTGIKARKKGLQIKNFSIISNVLGFSKPYT